MSRSGGDAEGRAAGGRIEIAAPIERVWRALTEAAELERWFPLEARVEPGVGGTVFMSWKNEYAGSERIEAWDPPRHLRLVRGGAEADAGPALVTEYLLEAAGGRTVLRVVTSGFPADAAWDDWVEGTRLGWLYELGALKHYLERHDGKDRRVLQLRRRVPLSPAGAWARLFAPDGLGERPLGGRPVSAEPPRHYAAAVDDPPGALLRVSVDPPLPGTAGMDVGLLLAAWGEAGGRLAALELEWSAVLERLFPDGEPL